MTRENKAARSAASRRAQLLLVAALLVSAALPCVAQAEQRAMRDAVGMTRPGPAPTGHRQPHAADVPQELNNDDEQLFAALDRKLKICRGC